MAGQKSIALNPELSEGWKAIGLVYNYQGDLINAQKHYEKALEFNPNFHPAIANLVPVYGRQGNIDKAMKTALRSMQANPLNSFSYTNISEGLKFLGMYDSAINKRGLEVTESYSIYRMQSEIYTDLGEIDLAKANFQKMLEMDSNPGYLITAAAIAVRLDTALSKEILGMIPELAQSQGEKYWSAYSTLGYLIQDPDSAQTWIDSGIDHYSLLFEANPMDDNIMEELFFLYAVNGQAEKAIEALELLAKTGFMYSVKLQTDPRLSGLWDDPTFIQINEAIDAKREAARMRITATTPELN